MKRPQEIDALVTYFGYRDAVKEAEGGWWSSCPVPLGNGDGPAFCGKRMFVASQEDGRCGYEPTCGHSVDEVLAAVTPRSNGNGPLEPSHDNARTLPPPTEPMRVARVLARDRYQLDDGTPTLRHWRGGWWQWRQSHWEEVEQRAVRNAAYKFCEHAVYEKKDTIELWAPNRHRIADLLEALAAVCHLRESLAQPGWIDGHQDGVIVACANGLLDVQRRELLGHTPRFFNVTAVPFDYEPDAAQPARWFGFLHDLWGEDGDSVAALQEFFGYVVSGRLDQHKILLLVGPTRAGKGVIARTLTALVGSDNVAGRRCRASAVSSGWRPCSASRSRSCPTPGSPAAARRSWWSGCWRSPARTRSP
jgi:hypothetical protein